MLNISPIPFVVLAIALSLTTCPAFAASYTGNYPITLSDGHPDKGKPVTECMGITDNGSVLGYTHSGPVSFNGANNGAVFLVINDLLLFPVLYNGENIIFVSKVSTHGLGAGAVMSTQGKTPVGGNNLKVGAPGSC